MKVRQVLGAAVVAGAAAVIVTGPGVFASGGTPANKVVAAGDSLTEISAGTSVDLLKATMKTSKPTDLMIQPTLECTILTALTTDSTNLSATARSAVRVWIEIDEKVVPIEQVSSPPQDGTTPEEGSDTDKVTFCDREYSRTMADDEGDGGVDSESDYIRTKSSHGFNWVKMNVGSGMHEIVLKGEFTTTGETVNSTSEAIVGNRTMIVEPTKMANNAIIANEGSGTSGTSKSLRLKRKLRRR